jgi:hypothetical protein
MVAQLDALIARGQASSRASVVEADLRRELRAHLHAQEAELMAQAMPDSDLESVVDWVFANRPDLN